MKKSFTRTLLSASFLSLIAFAHAALAQTTLTPIPLHLDVLVSDIGTDNSLAQSNTSRKLAVAADGTVYALFRSPTNGIRLARSSNRGQSFQPSVQVTAINGEAEIAVASDGDIHVIWVQAGSIMHVVSRDGGTTFTSPVTAGTATSSAHMALDGNHVYAIPSNGSVVYHSATDGLTFGQTTTGGSYVFADIFADPVSRDVLVAVDDPSVYFYKSTDFGQTFSAPTTTGKSVFYSVGALSVTGSARYLFIAGQDANLERIEVDTPAYFTGTVSATSGSSTRSLSSDVFGNVVSGYLEAGTNNLSFQHSNDLAASFGAATTVVTAASRANAAINTINGDILFLYEKNGLIYLSTYERGLVGYDINVSPSALSFDPIEVGQQASLPVTLSNVSPGAVTINSVTASANFSATNNCGASVAAMNSCTVTVTFMPTAVGAASGVLTLNIAGSIRQVALNAFAVAALPETTTELSASETEVVPGSSITLTASVAGAAPTGNVTFFEDSVAIASCTALPLTGNAASCVVSGLSEGQKQYMAAYGGDGANRPSVSVVVTVKVVQLFTVTPSTGAGGTMNPAVPQSIPRGSTATFAVTPDASHAIASVVGCGGSLSSRGYFTVDTGTSYFTTGPISADCTVTATFAAIFLVTPSAGAGGSLSPALPQNVVSGGTVAFTVAPNAGYQLATVSGCGGVLSGTTYTTGAITANCTVTATFAAVFVVTPSAGAGGSLNPAVPQNVVSGASIAFTVAPSAGYQVASVSGCGGVLSGTTYTTGAITANCAVTATFAAVLVVTPNAGAGGSLSPALPQNVVSGGSITFAVVPQSGYGVASVSGCGGVLSGTNYTTGAITANCTVTAAFALLQETVQVTARSGGGSLSWLTIIAGFVALLVRCLLPARAFAAEQTWYVGATWGQARGEQGAGDVADDLEDAGFVDQQIQVDDLNRDAYRLFAGYRFKANWVVEAGYTDLGDVSASASATVPAGEAQAYARALLDSLPASASGYELTVGYHYPINQAFTVLGRVGFWYWENDAKASFGDERLADSLYGTDFLLGVGVDWTFTPQWSVGFEAARYRVDDEDLDLLGLNLKFAW